MMRVPDTIWPRHIASSEMIPTAAARLVSGHWRLSLDQPETIKSIAFMLARVHNYAEAEEVFDAFVASGGSDPQIFSGPPR